MKQALMPSVVHHAHANLRLRHQHLQLGRQGTDQRRTDAGQRFAFGSGSVVATESNVKGHMAPLLITKGHRLYGDPWREASVWGVAVHVLSGVNWLQRICIVVNKRLPVNVLEKIF
ncbi:hypothetical protein [Acidovorax radicis]|uniref:hypothetical protein n=1 Tax=Acidovorax radicis TaxID=758826 RepID=UPI001111B174|nr:hypothetical protein [Acidovorax radicis]